MKQMSVVFKKKRRKTANTNCNITEECFRQKEKAPEMNKLFCPYNVRHILLSGQNPV